MREFLFILKGDGLEHLSPQEMQQVIQDYKAWMTNLGDQYLDGQRLENKGAQVKDKNTIVTDGPFLEAKEIIAGFYVIMAPDQDAANAIAQSSPHAGLYTIEVRPLAQPTMRKP